MYKLGFPRGAEDQIHPVTIALNGVVPGLRDLDPAYFDDFWARALEAFKEEVEG